MNVELKINIHGYTFHCNVEHYHNVKSNPLADNDWDYQGYTDLEFDVDLVTDEYGEQVVGKELQRLLEKYENELEIIIGQDLYKQIESDYDGDY